MPLSAAIDALRIGLMAFGLLWAADAFAKIAKGEALRSSIGRATSVAGAAIVASELLFALGGLLVRDRLGEVLASLHRPLPAGVEAVVVSPGLPVSGVLAFGLAIVVVGRLLDEVQPIVDEHDLTV